MKLFILCFSVVGFFLSCTFADDIQDRYNFAYKYGVTNTKNVQDYNDNKILTKEQLSKLIVLGTRSFLTLDLDIVEQDCNADDYSQDLGVYSQVACQRGLFPIKNNHFMGYELVTSNDVDLIFTKLVDMLNSKKNGSYAIDTSLLPVCGNINNLTRDYVIRRFLSIRNQEALYITTMNQQITTNSSSGEIENKKLDDENLKKILGGLL